MIKFPGMTLIFVLLWGLLPAAPFAQEQVGADKVVFHVDENDQKIMDLTLNNVQNLLAYYKEKGQKIQIEIVAYGPGLHMLRQDTSPVKDRISSMALEHQEIQFSACSNTLDGMTKREGSKPQLISEAKLVPAGVVRLVELQKQGYAYIKP